MNHIAVILLQPATSYFKFILMIYNQNRLLKRKCKSSLRVFQPMQWSHQKNN